MRPRNSTPTRSEWADQHYNLDLAARYDAITARLRPGASITAAFADCELSLSIDGVPVIERIFVDAAEGEFIAAQWKVVAATFTINEKTDGTKLAKALRNLAVPDNLALVQQIIALEGELSALDAEILREEGEMNTVVNRLYDVTHADVTLIEKDNRPAHTTRAHPLNSDGLSRSAAGATPPPIPMAARPHGCPARQSRRHRINYRTDDLTRKALFPDLIRASTSCNRNGPDRENCGWPGRAHDFPV